MKSTPVALADPDASAYAAALGAAAADSAFELVAIDAAEVVLGAPDQVAAALRAGHRFRWVQSTWAGITPLLDADLPRDYQLTGLAGVFGPWMAQYVLGYLLQLDQRIASRIAIQNSASWRPLLPQRLDRRRVLVLGTGDIGAAIASALRALGCAVVGISRTGSPHAAFTRAVGAQQLDTELAACDTLIATLPETPDTRGLLDARRLALLPQGAVLINVGRGSLLDESALIARLRSGALAAAVLDVTRDEPLRTTDPLWSCPNLLLTQHVAGPSVAEDIAPLFLTNLERYRRGDGLLRRIDFARGY